MSKVGEYQREMDEMGIDEFDIGAAVKLKKPIKKAKRELNSPLYRGEKK